MKISYEWLREYVNTKIRAEHLASLLTMAGHEVTFVETKGKDFIFEIEVTSNRPDCLNHIGMAREVACITQKKLTLPVSAPVNEKLKDSVRVNSVDKTNCPYYSARLIKNVKVLSSPKWLARRLEILGLRPVNNIVDITNFILLETGQPLHAFDFDKVAGGEIIIRSARKNEKITTIDGITRELEPLVLVIADKEKPIAVAGIMGGKETEVTEDTQNVLLESAYFNPVSIRKTALSLGLNTDSSYRFERGVDLAAVLPASNRATVFICDIASGNAAKVVEAGIGRKQPRKISLRFSRVNKILGTELTQNQVKQILSRLGFNLKASAGLEVIVPTYRNDITREADLIEEIARVYGYENIIPQPPTIITTMEDPEYKDRLKKTDITKQVLTSLGFNESLTYSLISKETIKRIGLPEEAVIEIKNPLSREQEIMRQSLLAGVIRTVSYNLSRQLQDIKIFELSNIYFIKGGSYIEEAYLAIAQYSKMFKKDKEATLLTEGLSHLKGAIVLLGERLGIAKLDFEKTHHPLFVPAETLAVLSADKMLGTAGRIKAEALKDFDIKGELFAAELNFDLVAQASNLNKFYRPLPNFPFSYRDVSFAVNRNIPYKDIAALIRKSGYALIEDIELLSEYLGKEIPAGQKALALRIIYRLKDKTLTEEEINRVDKAVRDSLVETFNVTLR